MTAIIGIRTEEGCIIAADGRNFSEGGGQNPITEPKISRKREWLAFSFSGSWRMSQILDTYLQIDTEQRLAPKDPLRWLVRIFVPSVQEALAAHNWQRHGDDTVEWPIHPGVVAVADRIFYVDGGYHVSEPLAPYITSGAGEAEASAGMHVALRECEEISKVTALVACTWALEAVEYHRADCGRPFHWAETIAPSKPRWHAGEDIYEIKEGERAVL